MVNIKLDLMYDPMTFPGTFTIFQASNSRSEESKEVNGSFLECRGTFQEPPGQLYEKYVHTLGHQFFGRRPQRGRSPVEHRGFLFIHPFIHLFVPPPYGGLGWLRGWSVSVLRRGGF